MAKQAKQAKSGTAVLYKGDGASLPDIPARDLSVEELAALTAEQKDAMKQQGLYTFLDNPVENTEG